MKRKIVAILVCILIAIGSAFNVVASTSVEKQKLITKSNSSKQLGNTLITESYYVHRVIEVNNAGNIVWQMTDLNYPVDAERLENGNTLIVERDGNRVIEVDSSGTIVWEYSGMSFIYDAERLENGNTLITDGRVIEVDSSGNIVWEKTGLEGSQDAERLENGNTLIPEFGKRNRVIEVDSSGTIVWEVPADTPIDVERLANGNTLITEFVYGHIKEVDSEGNIVWEYTGGSLYKFDAERLANGNTLISDPYNFRVIEVDSSGNIVWEKTLSGFPMDVERLANNPPNAPTIDGKTSGKAGTEYEYTFNATDPDNDDVKYYINWGDTNTEWTDFNTSGTDVKVKHTWSEDGTYNITAKAQDINGVQGPEGTLTVSIPRNKPSNFNINMLERFLRRFPNMFPILRYLLRVQ